MRVNPLLRSGVLTRMHSTRGGVTIRKVLVGRKEYFG